MAKYQITSPDGQKFEITAPDDATEQQVMEYARTQFAQPETQPSQNTKQSTTGGLMDAFSQGATFNFGDELTALEAGVLGRTPQGDWFNYSQPFAERYSQALQAERGQRKQFSQEHPVISTAAEIGGGLSTGLGAASRGFSLMQGAKATIPSMMARGAAEGAIYGGLYGAGSGENAQERVNQAITGAGIGGMTGGIMGAVGGKLAQNAERKAVPSVEQLKGAANTAYDAAEKSGVIISKSSFGKAVNDIKSAVADAGIDKTLHPRAMAAIDRLSQASDENITFKGADLLRRVAKAAASSNDADERRIGSIIISKLDDYISNLKPSDVIAGDTIKATSAINDARNLWMRQAKGSTIENLIQKARDSSSQFTGAGYENALRVQFRQLAKNQNKMRAFTKDEQEAIRKIANGTFTGNLLRWVGKFAPHGYISALGSSGAGYAVGGPVGAVAVPTIGELGRLGATAMTANNAKLASELVRRGSPPMLRPLTGVPAYLTEGLLVGGAQQAPQLGLLTGRTQ